MITIDGGRDAVVMMSFLPGWHNNNKNAVTLSLSLFFHTKKKLSKFHVDFLRDACALNSTLNLFFFRAHTYCTASGT